MLLLITHSLMNIRSQLLCIWCGPAMPWAIGIAGRLRVTEGEIPVLTYTQIGCVAIGSLIGQSATWIFEAAAYRLDDTPPVVVRALHDLGWFTFLAPWPSFTVWCFALALAIFGDQRKVPDFARWAKVGPFSWNGVIAFYVPVFIFFIWVAGLTVPALQAVQRSRNALTLTLTR